MYSSKLSNYQLIFTFLKENIKSRNTKDKVKTERTVKNNSNRSDLHVQRNCFSNQQKKKTTLHVQHTFWYISLPLFCGTKNTFTFLFTRFMEEMLVFLFFWQPRQHFSFSNRCYRSLMLFLQRSWSPLLFISRSSSFPVIQVNVAINIQRKERCFLSLSLNVRAAM